MGFKMKAAILHLRWLGAEGYKGHLLICKDLDSLHCSIQRIQTQQKWEMAAKSAAKLHVVVQKSIFIFWQVY